MRFIKQRLKITCSTDDFTYCSARAFRDHRGKVQVRMRETVWLSSKSWAEHRRSLWEIAESFFKQTLSHSTQKETSK